MLDLIFANGNEVCSIEQDVGGLEHRIVQQPCRNAFLPRCFILELRLALELTQGRDRVEYPGEFGMFRHHRLDEHRSAGWVQPRRQQRYDHLAPARAEVVGVVRDGDRVIVHDAEERFEAPLELDPVLHRPEIVADMKFPRRLNAAEYS